MDAATWANIGTAAGTLALAAATFWLARRSSQQAASSRTQAAASQKQAEAAVRQAELLAGQLATAQDSLRATTRPLLADVPRDDEDTGTRAYANIAHEDNDVVYGSVPVRNVGAGPAVLVECRLAASAQAMEAQQWAPGHASQNVLAPGERVRIYFQAAPGSAAYGTLFDHVVGCEQMVMEIRYRDLVEDHEGVLKAELRCDRSSGNWRVASSEVRFRIGSSLRLSPQPSS